MFLLLPVSETTVFAYPTVYPRGTTINKQAKVYKGYTIFVSSPLNRVLLINMKGKVEHYWEVPGFVFIEVKPLSNGNILAIGSYVSQKGKENRILVELDWNSNIVWEFSALSDPHHDYERLENGNTLILYLQDIFEPTISNKQITDDYIVEVDPSGQIVWEWYTYQHFSELEFSPETAQLIYETGGDWAHTNSIQSLPDNMLGDTRFKKGNILVSQRNTNTLFVIDKDSGQIVWKIGPENNHTIGQHNANMIEMGIGGEGRILVFDNGGVSGYPSLYRLHSKVVEIDPLSAQIVDEYDAYDSGLFHHTFFSAFVGGAQRLPNNNTLICEGLNGRLFEVTSSGEIVWEYISPYGKGPSVIYRAYRVDPSWIVTSKEK
jgi:outer membrane protein assembly factor BamB